MALVLFILLKVVNKITTGNKKEEEAAVKTDEAVLLEEIRDLLKKKK